jgi:Penicillinase repressor
MRIRTKITLRGFRPNARGAGHVLGELETAVMELLWREAELTVNQVEERLRQRSQIAHTTVLTTLDRMRRKGRLTLRKKARRFLTRHAIRAKSSSAGWRRRRSTRCSAAWASRRCLPSSNSLVRTRKSWNGWRN